MAAMNTYFVTCPPYVEGLLEQELKILGAITTKQQRLGVETTGSLEFAYRTCLWSRLSNRCFLQLQESIITSPEELYAVVYAIDWSLHLSPKSTFRVDFIGQGAGIKHTNFGGLKVKDAIVDKIRGTTGLRPSIDKEEPDLVVAVHLHHNKLNVYLDLSGDSLHKRGYRHIPGSAPLKENLAAALLMSVAWPTFASAQKPLVDPLCGSGTLLIEALMMTGDIAPNLQRDYFGFLGWQQHDIDLWKALLSEAKERKEKGLLRALPSIIGYDADHSTISNAKQSLKHLGFESYITLSVSDFAHFHCQSTWRGPGLLISNPPYGERLGNISDLHYFYQQFGRKMKEEFSGWDVAIFTGEQSLAKAIKMAPTQEYRFKNGDLNCRLYYFEIYDSQEKQSKEDQREFLKDDRIDASSHIAMLINRLEKNRKKLSTWLKKQNIDCYRLYDADIPEYAAAIDYYAGYLHVQEYAPPKTVDAEKAQIRFSEILRALKIVFECTDEKIFIKQRQKQKGGAQYQKQGKRHHMISVREYDCQFLVNLTNYVDTGIFLDSRPVRRSIFEEAKGKRFLNLFCYTATASVQAAMGGAKSTTSVDLSPTYVDWARKNFALNGLNDVSNQVIEADCMKWLAENTQKFDLILLDPPTFSNSKRTDSILDIERCHVFLIRQAMRALSKEGKLIFCNNYRKFKLETDELLNFSILDITEKTFDPDFKRDTKLHHCFIIKHQ